MQSTQVKSSRISQLHRPNAPVVIPAYDLCVSPWQVVTLGGDGMSCHMGGVPPGPQSSLKSYWPPLKTLTLLHFHIYILINSSPFGHQKSLLYLNPNQRITPDHLPLKLVWVKLVSFVLLEVMLLVITAGQCLGCFNFGCSSITFQNSILVRSDFDGESLCAKLWVEEDAWVDDLLCKDEEVEGGRQVCLVSWFRQLTCGIGVKKRKRKKFHSHLWEIVNRCWGEVAWGDGTLDLKSS